MELSNILKELNYINNDQNGNVCLLPNFTMLLNKFINLFKNKLETEGYQEIYFDDKYNINENNYTYYYLNYSEENIFNIIKKMPNINFIGANENEELMRHKIMNMISFIERFSQECAAVSTLSGKIVNENKFKVYTMINDCYMDIAEIDYINKKFVGKINLALLFASLINHLDEQGLIVPPSISNFQVCFLLDNLATANDYKKVDNYVKELSSKGIRAFIDFSSEPMKDKITHRIKEGVQLLIEVYHKNIEKNSFILVNRLTGEKKKISSDDFKYLDSILEDMQRKIYQLNLKKHLNNKPLSISCCMDQECIDSLKEEKHELIIPFLQIGKADKCQICGNNVKKLLIKIKKI